MRSHLVLSILIFIILCGCTPLTSPTEEQTSGNDYPSLAVQNDNTATPSIALAFPQNSSTPLPLQITSTSLESATATSQVSDTPQASPTLTSQKGTVISSQVTTSLLDQPLSFLIYLPPGYSAQGSQHYPVLYLLHGMDYSDDQWVRLGMTSTADRLIAAGEIAPLIIVMPNEITFPLPDQTNFGKAVATVLVPWIDSHYLTLTDRTDRAIGGLSRGASWAVRLGLIYWQTFGSIGAHSYPMFYGDALLIPGWLKAIPDDSYPRIYLDVGDHDPNLSYALNFEQTLTTSGISHEFHLFKGYHDEDYWKAHVEDYLRWYSAGW